MDKNILIKIKTASKYILILLLVLAGLFIISKLVFFVFPFIIAFILSSAMEPLIKKLMKKLNIQRKTAVALSLILIFSVFGLLLTLVISRLITELINLSIFLPGYFSEAYKNLDSLIKKLFQIYINLPDGVTKNIENIFQNLSQSITELLNSIIKTIINTAVSIPEALIYIIVTTLSTYFFASDKDKIYDYFKTGLPDKLVSMVRNIKKDMFYALFGYIKAQLILMSITFTELFTGFVIIQVRQPLALALFISIVDILPILGTGSILIPWLLYEFLIGNVTMGISLLLIYLIILIVRQMIEPKILSKQIGIHPLLTLMAMYIGLKLFGFFGLVFGPITILLIKNILSGVFKSKPLKQIVNRKY